jgi:hypothetical protein
MSYIDELTRAEAVRIQSFRVALTRAETRYKGVNMLARSEATYRIPADDEVAAMRYDTRYVDGRFEYGRWHRDAADRLVWTPYQPPQPVTDGMQEPG